MDTLMGFLVFLGTPAAWASIVSYLLEPWDVFAALSIAKKRIVVLVLAGRLPVGSYLLVTFLPADLVAKLEPLYGLLFIMGVGLNGSQLFHKYFNVPPPVAITAQAVDETHKDAKG